MNEELVNYLKNQIVQAPARLRPYTRTDTNWVYPRRYAFYRMSMYISKFLVGQRNQRWLIMPGLRGVGKTTLLAQCYFEIEKALPASRRIYVSLDDAVVTIGANLKQVLDAYEIVLGEKLEDIKEPIILFIDEVQEDENWALVLKTLYDRARNVLIICTGSSAVSLQTNPDIVRRAVIEKIYPLCFGEFEMIKNNIYPQQNLKQDIKNAIYSARNAVDAYANLKAIEGEIAPVWTKIKTPNEDVESYLRTGTLPFAIKAVSEAQAYENISILLDRMITKDLAALGRFDKNTLGQIKRILYIMADSDTLSVNKISKEVGMTNVTLNLVLDALEKAELIIKVPAFGSNSVAIRKPAKYLFMTPAIRMSLLNVAGVSGAFSGKKGPLLEDIIGLHFYREFVAKGAATLRYDSNLHSADFIFQIADKRRIIVEVGAGSKSGAQVKNTMQKMRSSFGLVLCSDGLELHRDDNIVKVPLAYFLLM